MEVRLINSEDNWTQYKLVGDISNASTTGDDSSVLSPLDLPSDEVTKHILFDLNDATFLDSSGIGWLLSVQDLLYQRSPTFDFLCTERSID